jgi:hypothetical protein
LKLEVNVYLNDPKAAARFGASSMSDEDDQPEEDFDDDFDDDGWEEDFDDKE